MPISDSDDYEPGHFKRVYEYIIKPAGLECGYEMVRADEVAKSNYIVIDILRKILDSDLVICDLSNRNPNVLYELGIRQAFNKPTVLIKDSATQRIFDIQGLRCAEYDETLRVDSVKTGVERLSSTIRDTESLNSGDVNSIIQLLAIQPAEEPKAKEISPDTGVILSAINDVSSRLSIIERGANISLNKKHLRQKGLEIPVQNLGDDAFELNNQRFKKGSPVYVRGSEIGILLDAQPHGVYVKTVNDEVTLIDSSDELFYKLESLPF